MVGLGSAFIALAVLVSGQLENLERVTPEMAIERAAQCGLGRASIRYEDELQSHILSATGFGIDVELPPSVQPLFYAIRGARASALMKAEAREWLSKRGLLDLVPKYVPGKTDEGAFTREVERLCGPRTKGAFQSQYGPHALSPEWVKNLGLPPKDEDMEAMSCLLNVTSVAGFEMGFIGNEAYRH